MKRLLLGLLACLLAVPALAQTPVVPYYQTQQSCQGGFAQCFAPIGPATPFHAISTSSTNSTLVKSGAGLVGSIVALNPTVTLYYIKFSDTATAPVCGTTPVVQTYMIPFGSSNSGGGIVLPIPTGIQFNQGIGYCITGAVADNDTSNAASGLVIDVLFK